LAIKNAARAYRTRHDKCCVRRGLKSFPQFPRRQKVSKVSAQVFAAGLVILRHPVGFNPAWLAFIAADKK